MDENNSFTTEFRGARSSILVATDVAARGLGKNFISNVLRCKGQAVMVIFYKYVKLEWLLMVPR